MSDTDLPEPMELLPLNDEFRKNPYPVLGRLREHRPVYEDTELKRVIYTRHDDVKAILRDAKLWSDPRKANPGTFTREFLGQNLKEDEQPSMLMMDEPDHHRLRSLVSQSFTPAAVEKWRGRTREVVARVLQNISTSEFDLMAEFAGPVPTIVIAELLGIDTTDVSRFKEWSDTSVAAAFNPFPTEKQIQARDQANQNLNAFF